MVSLGRSEWLTQYRTEKERGQRRNMPLLEGRREDGKECVVET